MQVEYLKDAAHNYLIIPRNKRTEEGYQEKMAQKGNVEGLISFDIRYLNGDSFYYYDLRSKHSLKLLSEQNRLGYQEILMIMTGLRNIQRNLSEYLLLPVYLLLNPEYIFLDPENKELSFVFFPEKEEELADTYQAFAEFLINSTNYEDEQAKELCYGYFENVTAGFYDPDIILNKRKKEDEEIPLLEELLLAEDSQEREEGKRSLYLYSEPREMEYDQKKNFIPLFICIGIVILVAAAYLILFLNPEFIEYFGIAQEDYILAGGILAAVFAGLLIFILNFYKKRERKIEERELEQVEAQLLEGQAKRVDRIEQEVFENQSHLNNMDKSEETIILSHSRKPSVPKLVSINGEKQQVFSISKNPFIVGKLSGKADAIIESRGISRVHAAIREENGEYCVSDLNSTNGTKVNGQLLIGVETCMIHPGDILSFADDEYTFVM